MSNSLIPAALGTGFIFLMTVLGAAAVFFVPRHAKPGGQTAVMGLCAGVMTAAAFWSLLLPAIERAAEYRLPGWLPAAVGVLLGVSMLAAMDAVMARRAPQTFCGTPLCRENVLLFTAITLHNIPEGMAVGLAFALSRDGEALAAAGVLALGIGVQNFPEGAAISLPMKRSGLSPLRCFGAGVLSGLVEPVFGMLAVLVTAGFHALMPWLLSFAAGAMLYVVVEELIPQAHSKAGTCAYMAGFLLMMILDVALG